MVNNNYIKQLNIVRIPLCSTIDYINCLTCSDTAVFVYKLLPPTDVMSLVAKLYPDVRHWPRPLPGEPLSGTESILLMLPRRAWRCALIEREHPPFLRQNHLSVV